MSTKSNMFAPDGIVAARDKLEAVDARLAAVRDESRAARNALKGAVAKDRDEGAAAELAGEQVKDPRKNERAAEARIADLEARVRSVEAAYKIAREEMYLATVADREDWLAALEAPEAEARAELAENLAGARRALATMAQTDAARRFLGNFVADPADSRSQDLARQKIARFQAYWPGSGRLAFPNRVEQFSVPDTPMAALDFLARVLEEKQPPPFYKPDPGEPSERFKNVS